MAVVGGLRIVGDLGQRCPYTQATVDAKLLARRRPHLVFHSLWRPVAGRDRMRVGAGRSPTTFLRWSMCAARPDAPGRISLGVSSGTSIIHTQHTRTLE